jgi:hypothetical protein
MRKPKVKEYVTKLEYPLFNYSIWICITEDIVKSIENQNTLLGNQDTSDLEFCDGVHCYHKNRAAIFIKPDSTEGTIAHELWHGIYRMFEYIGAKIENEVTAYCLSYGLDFILNFKKKKDKLFKVKYKKYEK